MIRLSYHHLNTFILLLPLILTITALLFLIIPKISHKYNKLTHRLNLTLKNQLIYTIRYFIYAVLISMVIDSVWSIKKFYNIHHNGIGIGIDIGIDSNNNNNNFTSDHLYWQKQYKNYYQTHHHAVSMKLQMYVYLVLTKKQQHCVAAVVALFVWFAFCQIYAYIVQYVCIQYEEQNMGVKLEHNNNKQLTKKVDGGNKQQSIKQLNKYHNKQIQKQVLLGKKSQ